MNAENLGWSLGISLVFCACFAADVSAQTIVQVDCTKKNPKSINEQITKKPSSLEQQLIIEIVGMCVESVDIHRRDNIVLRGSDPLIDGISAVSGDTLDIRYSSNITVENLKITGSPARGIVVGDSGIVTLMNTRVEGNGGFGLRAFRALVVADLLVVTGNGGGGVGMGGSTPSRLVCFTCTIEENPAVGSGVALRVVRASSAVLVDGVLEGQIGVQSSTAGHVDLFDTMVTGSQLSISADNHARVRAVRGNLTGSFVVDTKSSLGLSGVAQPSANSPNVVRFDAYLNTTSQGATRTSLVSTALEDFSNASFRDTDLGILTCSQGSNAFCDNVTKTSSDCSLCP